MNKLIISLAAAVLSVAAAAAPAKLPEPLLSAYTGFNFNRPKYFHHVEKMIQKMGKQGFNSIEVKIQHNLRSLELTPANIAKVQRIYDLAKANDMIFQLYIYPLPFNGQRNPAWEEHKSLPCPVDNKGNRIENVFLLTDVRVWRNLFRNADQWIELRKTIPFVSLKFDIETIGIQYSYDDDTWQKFCKKYPKFDPATPVSQRGDLIRKRRFVGKYYIFFQGEVEKAVKEWLDGIHAKDPDLILGYMPARRDKWLCHVLERHLATADKPAICDGWALYNGSGYTDEVKKHAGEVKTRHPNNILITWTRPNSYEPEDITTSVYHTAANTAGYSLWTLYMLDPELKLKKYALPGNGKWNADDYFAAFGKANKAIAADLKAGTRHLAKRIPYRKAKALVVPLDIKSVTTPEFLPAGNGSGKDKEFVLRNQQVIRIYAKAGEMLDISLRHLAGNKRPVSLQYALFDQKKDILHNEAVNPGNKTRIRVPAPHTGCYTFTVSGGSSQAWYGVTVHTKYYAFDAAKSALFFGPQTVYMPGKDMGNPTLLIDMQNLRQSHNRRINGGDVKSLVRAKEALEKLPSGIVKVEFSDYNAPGTYTQDFLLSFPRGKNPLLFGQPERRLVLKK